LFGLSVQFKKKTEILLDKNYLSDPIFIFSNLFAYIEDSNHSSKRNNISASKGRTHWSSGKSFD